MDSQEPTRPEENKTPPLRSIRELVELLGSPVCEYTSVSPRPGRSAPASPDSLVLEDPVPPRDEEQSCCAETDLALHEQETSLASLPSHPWNTSTDSFDRPDRFSRTTTHTTISEILFNFDLDAATATDLIDDACHTARQVGVSTHELLSRSVFIGTTDLGMTPLCLEASRVDLEQGMDLVLWLIENTRPSDVHGEVAKGCLMRLGGMGEQSVWNVLRGFIPQDATAYDVEVVDDPDQDDQASLYDDIEIIDQADIETLKSSSDAAVVHRARIVMPLITGPPTNRLTAEWISQGRLWALSMRETSLALTLRQASSPDPIRVQATVRLWPLDMPWGEINQDVFPLYECELGEREVVPGPIRTGGRSSISKTGIRVSMFSLLDLVGSHSGLKFEVFVRVREAEDMTETDDTDWQFVDD